MIPTEFEAILSLVGGRLSNRVTDEDKIEYTYHDGQTPPKQTEIDAELKRMQDEYEANEYQRSRASEYPPWNEQLDKIFHDGVAKWKSEMIQPIKDKYPKP